ncbi:MAG: sulfurtransferase TusA family protein, partial [Acidobacteria bacterium]|nr:sulfurtransferase TusA family protein [Acidobacteriota bacterium]
MSRVIDARGMACPQPVLLTKKAIAEENQVTAIVDGETARQNVTRMAEKQGCRVRAEEREDGIYLHIAREGEAAQEAQIAPGTLPAEGPLVVSVAGEFMGRGDDVLGNILIRAFFHTLGEVEPR